MIVTKISCGHSQSGALTNENEFYSWGHNSDYRIMNSNPKNHSIPTLTEFHKLKKYDPKKRELEIISISMGVSHMIIVTSK
mmetsp:Transcript_28963/g.26309  ORF Transcript_28963/g.26309 Transcript_28963/m.26309 type:complete len:81 (-) Transcript_28963:96-338(-)